MNPVFFRDFAQRVRKLMAVARTEATRHQLAIWVEEFEQRAKALESEFTGKVADKQAD